MDDTPQSLGGRARAEALSPERRAEIASQAAAARWSSHAKPAKKRTLRIAGDLYGELEHWAAVRNLSVATAIAIIIADAVGLTRPLP